MAEEIDFENRHFWN